MRQSMLRVLVTLTTLSMVMGVAQADRRTSLGGNMLISDRDDTFVYPQLALKYKQSVSIDFGTAQGEGNALLIAAPNKKSALAIALHRGDTIASLGNSYGGSPESGMIGNSVMTLEIPGMSNSARPPIIADLIYAMKMGKNNKLGFRLGFVGIGANQTNDGDHVGTDSSFGFRLGAGYSMGKNGDFAFNFGMGTASVIAGKDKDDVSDASNMLVGLSGRYFLKRGKKLSIGSIFDVGFQSVGNTTYGGDDPKLSRQTFGLSAGVGPVYRKKNKYTVAFYGHFGVRNVSEDPNSEQDDDETSDLTVVFPGFNIAMEYRVLDWLELRSSAYYSYLIMGSSTAGDVVNSQNNMDNFGWQAGVGIVFDHLKLNGTLSHGFVTGGPQFVSGYQGNLFSMLSVVGNFGGKSFREKKADAPAAK